MPEFSTKILSCFLQPGSAGNATGTAVRGTLAFALRPLRGLRALRPPSGAPLAPVSAPPVFASYDRPPFAFPRLQGSGIHAAPLWLGCRGDCATSLFASCEKRVAPSFPPAPSAAEPLPIGGPVIEVSFFCPHAVGQKINFKGEPRFKLI